MPMLLRWGLVYILGVTAVILGVVVSWQFKLMSASSERHRIAVEKFEALEVETKTARTQALDAERIAARTVKVDPGC